ncbi:MAG: AAA family ATPase [Acidobacteria bacterium]|nr:AAA family ATPase [Acidobacteriota bacterium]
MARRTSTSAPEPPAFERAGAFGASEFAKALGITREQLDAYERDGTLPSPRRRIRGEVAQRAYSVDDLIASRVALGIPSPLSSPRRQLFLNFKGGVGKTVIAANYAYRVARHGLRVLAIDLDAQGHLTKCLGLDPAAQPATLLDVLRDRVPIDRVRVQAAAGLSNLDVLPANLALSPIELVLSQKNAREFQLKKALDGQVGRYDVIVLDAPPNLSLLNLNAILAIDDLIVPVLTDFLSYDGLRILFENLETVREDFGFEPERIGILVNGYTAGESLSQQSRAAIEQFYGGLVLDTVVRKSTAFGQATAEQKPVLEIAPRSKAAADIDRLVTELLGI